VNDTPLCDHENLQIMNKKIIAFLPYLAILLYTDYQVFLKINNGEFNWKFFALILAGLILKATLLILLWGSGKYKKSLIIE
jgi:hypothetical protein